VHLIEFCWENAVAAAKLKLHMEFQESFDFRIIFSDWYEL